MFDSCPKTPTFFCTHSLRTVGVSVTDLGNVVYVLARQSWPTCWGDYLQFVLYKENKDTTAAVGLLAKFTKYDATFLSFHRSTLQCFLSCQL